MGRSKTGRKYGKNYLVSGITPEQKAWLDYESDRTGLSRASIIKILIQREVDKKADAEAIEN